jgi:hypothetical protein
MTFETDPKRFALRFAHLHERPLDFYLNNFVDDAVRLQRNVRVRCSCCTASTDNRPASDTG